MIPVGDSLRSRRFPFVNYTFIAINFVVFFYELSLQSQPVQITDRFGRRFIVGSRLDEWISQWGVVPCELLSRCPRGYVPADAAPDWVNLISAQFIHGGWAHILGNMLFLWVFGDNIEDAMGHVRYLVFYLLGGTIAALAQVAAGPSSTTPMVGASGAIAAVLGAYLVTYPRARIRVVIPIIIIPWLTEVPAILMMGFWFLTQVISVGALTNATGGGGGVAYFAHIGGFVAGAVLIWFFRGRRRSLDRNAPDPYWRR